MLAPKISLKQLLLFMIVVSFCLAITAMALQGNLVAVGLMVSICCLLIIFPFYACLYFVLNSVSRRFASQLNPAVQQPTRSEIDARENE